MSEYICPHCGKSHDDEKERARQIEALRSTFGCSTECATAMHHTNIRSLLGSGNGWKQNRGMELGNAFVLGWESARGGA